MNISTKLAYERKNRKLTKNELAKKLNNTFKSDIYSKKIIAKLEENEEIWNFNILDEVSYIFGLTISEFLNKGWNLYNREELDDITYHIKQYFDEGNISLRTTKNFSDLIYNHDIVNNNNWVTLPKYDIILQIYHDFCKKDFNDESNDTIIYRGERLLEKLELFAPLHKKNKNSSFPFRISYDTAGHTSITDKREPVNFLNLVNKIEASLFTIKAFYEDAYPYFWDNNREGLKKLTSYRNHQDIDYDQIYKELNIAPESLLSWENNEKSPKINDILKVCNFLGINIDVISSNSLENQNDINSQPVSEQLLALSNTYDLTNFRNNYFFSERKSILLLPKSRYIKIYQHLENKLTKEIGAKKAFSTMSDFLYNWYEFNKLRELLFYQLDGEALKTNALMYTEEEIDFYLGEDLYPESPIRLLTQLALHRIKKEHSTNLRQIIKENQSIDLL